MNNITMKKWFKAAGIRALKTMAQTAMAMIGTPIRIKNRTCTLKNNVQVFSF